MFIKDSLEVDSPNLIQPPEVPIENCKSLEQYLIEIAKYQYVMLHVEDVIYTVVPQPLVVMIYPSRYWVSCSSKTN